VGAGWAPGVEAAGLCALGAWGKTGDPATQQVLALTGDPNAAQTLYAGTEGGGVLKSANGGVTWTPINGSLTALHVYAVAADPTDPSSPTTLYAGTESDGIFRSTDGTSWSLVKYLDARVSALVVDRGNPPATPAAVYAGTIDGVLRSLDSGTSWVALEDMDGERVNALAVDPGAPGTLYAGTQGTGVFRTTDGGTNWNPASNGLTSLDVTALAVDPSGAGTVYAGTSGGVFKSTDGGNTWAAVINGLSVLSVTSLAFDGLSPATLYAGTGAGVFRTTDGATTWKGPALSGLLVRSLAAQPSGGNFYASATASVYRTSGTLADPPAGVLASDGLYPDRVGISWTKVPGATYEIYRKSPLDPTAVLLATTPAADAPGYEDATVAQGTIYSYRVAATDGTLCTEWSAPDTGYRDDHGGSLATATPLSPGGSVIASLTPVGDRDYFVITLARSGRLVVSLTSDSVIGHLSLMDGDAPPVAEKDAIDVGRLNFGLDMELAAGTYYVEVRASNAFASSQGTYTVSNTFTPDPTRGDFDADGKADLVWRHGATGDNAIWLMDGTSVKTDPLITAVPNLDWHVVAVGDYDGDGKADLAWRHVTLGTNAVWLMDGVSVKTAPPITAVPDTGWVIVGAGDFDGDAKTDLLWRHNPTGLNAVWLMDGASVKASPLITDVPDLDWHIVAIGDYDNDGKNDIAWRHATLGANAIWLMDGATVKAATLIPWVPDAGWVVVGTGDFDGDGKSDLLWRHSVTGDNAIWLMDGTTAKASAFITEVPDLDWHIVGLGDYDGDGRNDIAWRHTTLGANAIWLMDGATVRAAPLIPWVPDLEWEISD
jgi:photosystem II stability/assembly factor-like uncharacterized protein